MTILGEVLQVVKYIFMIYLLSRAVINFAKTYQKRANAKWEANNREHRSYLSKRSTSRAFTRKRATKDDLIELSELIVIMH